MVDRIEESREQDAQVEVEGSSDGSGTPPTAKISLQVPWWRLHNVFSGLERDIRRLQAAGMIIASDEPDNEKPMDGGAACGVERIVDQVGEHLQAYRVVIAEVLQGMGVPTPKMAAEPKVDDEPKATTPRRQSGRELDVIDHAEVIKTRIEATEAIAHSYQATWFTGDTVQVPAEDMAAVCNTLQVTEKLCGELISYARTVASELHELQRTARS